MLTQDTAWIRSRLALERQVVTANSVAAALEHRLHGPDVDQGQLRRGCDYAAEMGLAAVLCRPEHVATAARRLNGSGTACVTAVAFDDVTARHHDPEDLAAEALELVGAGASEVALVVAPGVEGDCLHLISEQVAAVVEAVTSEDRTVRVLLNTTEASKEQVSDCTALVGARDVALVQGGSFHGDRATFSQVEAMRQVLPPVVLLKWTQPLRSIEMMLVCMALGVNRFNGDIPDLLKSARRSTQRAPLMLPIYGVDF